MEDAEDLAKFIDVRFEDTGHSVLKGAFPVVGELVGDRANPIDS